MVSRDQPQLVKGIATVLLSVTLSAPLAMASSVVSTASGSETIAWDPAVLAFSPDCASTWLPRRRKAECIVEPVLDGSGNLHLFIALRPLEFQSDVGRSIE